MWVFPPSFLACQELPRLFSSFPPIRRGFFHTPVVPISPRCPCAQEVRLCGRVVTLLHFQDKHTGNPKTGVLPPTPNASMAPCLLALLVDHTLTSYCGF